MFYIITGKINQGKTTRILSIFAEKRAGDGFITPKLFEEGVFRGYSMVRLSSGESMPFIMLDGQEPANWKNATSYGKFVFSEQALAFAASIVDEIIKNGTSPVFIDEIGPLELAERGFYRAFEKIIATGRDVYVTIRESCVEDMIQKFNLTEYEMMPLTEEKAWTT